MTSSLNPSELEHLSLFGSATLQKAVLLETSANSIIGSSGLCKTLLNFAQHNIYNVLLANILVTFSGQMKTLATMENAQHASEVELVSAGKWFAIGKDTIFLQWVLIKATNTIIKRGEKHWTLDEFKQIQGYFIALIVMMFPGQRREV